MAKRYKLKKSAAIILSILLILIIALIIFIASLFKTKSYSVEYNLNEYKISENYDANERLFYYEIIYNNIKYNFLYQHNYIKETKLIKGIKSYSDEDYICLIIESSYIEKKPLCSKNGELIDSHLISNKLKEELSEYIHTARETITSYKNYDIYNTDNKILIWSYKGFSYLNSTDFQDINLFKKDVYNVPLATKINNYLVVPNYEQDYSFNQVYIINLHNNEVDKWSLKYEISYDSYVLGINDRSIFIVDKKNKIEYELVPHKKKMRIVASNNKQGVIYKNGKQEKISMNKLVTSEESFVYKNNYQFKIINKHLYLSYLDKNNNILISNQEVSSIIHIKDDEVYYLVNDTLYKYTINEGEYKVVSYSEWTTNNKNLIFIND